jgi:hypothetical protein
VTEEYILTQFNYHYDSQMFREWKDRMEQGDRLYQGDLAGLFPNENALPDIPYVENKFKNALHDLARLASEGRGAVKFFAEGDRDRDMKRARLREAINSGYWMFNRMQRREHQLYLDLAGSGAMGIAAYYDDRSPYPQIHRLDPRFCYPDVRDGHIQTLLKAESVKERVLAHQFPNLGLDGSGENSRDAYFVVYYDEEEVAEAVLIANPQGKYENARFATKPWKHNLGVIPVAFETLDTYDGAFHGLLEQLAGPLMVRNKAMRFMVDLMEQMAHAPIFEIGVENWDTEPGPMTVYHGDPNAERVEMSRIPPAAPAQSMWQLLGYMGDQEEREAIQPPSRAGQVSQSIASGSFVDRTQGQLTSVVKELQDKLASVREQMNEICMKTDETWMDKTKPLVHPVAGKNTYTPSEDIKGWYFHEVKFGAGAGLDRLNTDTRVFNALGARLISRETAREEALDYVNDVADEQDKIDRENLQDAIFQRMVQNPATPLSSIGQVWLEMKLKGASFEEALEEKMPEIIEQEKAIAAGGAAPPGAPPTEGGEIPPEEGAPATGPTPAQEQLALEAQKAPLLQLFNRNR